MAIEQAAERLADLLNVDAHEIRWEDTGSVHQPDQILHAGPFTLLLEWKGTGGVGPIVAAIDQVSRRTRHLDGDVIPLVAVPFMGETGRARCAEAGISWIDLSGNARISAPGIRILVEGKPNRYRQRGRPSTAFAPKSSRIARWLLLDPSASTTQRQLARATGVDEGHASRVIGKLREDHLVFRDNDGAIRPQDPALLLDAWNEDYNFDKHHILRGHVPARSGDLLVRQLADALTKESIPYAATGLAAAWLMDRFAAFRTATLYLKDEPAPGTLDFISFREETRGANVWLVVPNDEGVFHGSAMIDGVRCVHPIQVYLDLQAHPERAQDAAQRLRTTHLNWTSDD